MNPTERSDALISRRLNEVERETYDLLVPRHNKSAVDMEDFSGVYGKGVVAADLAEVNRLQKIFDTDQRKKGPEEVDNVKRGKILEALLAERIELDNWLGQEAETIVPSIFDDYKNGVDLLIEFQRDEGFKHLALSIDATTSLKSASEKIEKIKSDIKHGHLVSIKYFYSEAAGIRGILERVPKVVVGTGIATIKELSSLWLGAQKSRKEAAVLEKELGPSTEEVKELKRKAKELLSKLASHRVQFLILEEIRVQLEYFVKLAKKLGKPNIEDRYQNALNTVWSILEEKNLEYAPSEEDFRAIQNDPVYKKILEETSDL